MSAVFVGPQGQADRLAAIVATMLAAQPSAPGVTNAVVHAFLADVNYRTPRAVLRDIGLFIDAGERVKAAGPLDGDRIDIATHTDFAGLKVATLAAIGRARQVGFKNDDIAVLTNCGRERSALMPFDRLGGYTLRRFDGTYDDTGNPIFPGFVYAGARLIEARKTIEIEVRSRTGAKAHCSGCGQPLPPAPGFLAPPTCPGA